MTKILHMIDNEPSFFYYQENFFDTEELLQVKKYLLELEQKKRFKDGNCLTGKEVPRKQIWFQKENQYFCNNWKYRYPRWESEEYSQKLNKIEKLVNQRTNTVLFECLDEHLDNNIQIPVFNSCLLNLYRTGDDSIKPHRDTKDSFGTYPTISNISIGETRIIKIKKTLYNSEGSDSSNSLSASNSMLDSSIISEEKDVVIFASSTSSSTSSSISTISGCSGSGC